MSLIVDAQTAIRFRLASLASPLIKLPETRTHKHFEAIFSLSISSPTRLNLLLKDSLKKKDE
jgi:hypothetical protein